MAQQEYDETRVRWLPPAVAHIFEGTYSLLHCTVKGDTLYRGVFAVRMFPVSYPDQFISLRHHDIEEKVREIGMIPDLNEYPEAAQRLVRASLDRHYYEQIISRIHEVRNEFGLLFFTVETQRGREEFIMPWRHDRAEDYSANGKLLLDVSDNRYIVPDVAALPPTDRRRLTKYIYW
jgi:hypothetical protein